MQMIHASWMVSQRPDRISFSTPMHVPGLVAPQPIMAPGTQDWFSKAAGTVSDFLKQNPNEQESYSAAKETAEEMQGVHRRRAQLGVLALPLPSSIRSVPQYFCALYGMCGTSRIARRPIRVGTAPTCAKG